MTNWVYTQIRPKVTSSTAKVVKKSLHVSNLLDFTSCNVTFELTDGSLKELKLSELDYYHLKQNVTGMLTFKGAKYLSFIQQEVKVYI